MSSAHFDSLLGFLKATGDETRLKIVCVLSQRPYSVGELAEVLGLTAPTVSHHIAKLREAGIVNLSVEGNTHHYRLNLPLINRVKQNLLTGEMLGVMAEHILAGDSVEYFRAKADQVRAQGDAWLDDLDISEAERKVLHDYAFDGRLKQIPTKQKKLEVILRWLATKFTPGVRYPEREVNTILKEVHPDCASLRRALVEHGLLERENGGGMYWRASQP